MKRSPPQGGEELAQWKQASGYFVQRSKAETAMYRVTAHGQKL